MANIVDMLRDAIYEQDWGLVKEVYQMLGGRFETVTEPVAKPKRGRPKKAPAAKKPTPRKKAVSDEDFFAETPNLQPNIGSQQRTRTIQLGKKANLVDLKAVGRGKEFITPEVDNTYREPRQPQKKIKVRCDYCGNEELVYPSMAPQQIGDHKPKYRCAKCY